MNTNNIKKYAPQARREFIEAVGKRLNQFGVYTNGKNKPLIISEPSFSGSVMQIDGNSFDTGLAQARKRLTIRAERLGFEQLVEQMAYTWFNRLCAIRFMELHGYLDHGLRVLSPSPSQGEGRVEGNIPEILDHAQDVADQLGLDRNHIVELKLAGNKDEELYRHLLLGQCHKLHEAMPFLFEALDDETELLLPDNLTRTDSILRGLVDGIPVEDWQQVEIIGWLYQFYISEKKDQVIGNVVKSEDIPAATQLFTPNWIVKYLVQNSVGRQWLMTYPDSNLKAQMEYYIEPAEQDASVKTALAAITPANIEPESIKVIDPACGSGHILVEAYNLLKAIYEERGYRSRDIPKLILENNLFGLDIDDRAAQLAGFALMMKAREDDRRIFTRDIKLNVLALQSTRDLNLPELWRKLALNKDAKSGITESIFDDAQSNLFDAVDNADFKALQSVLVLFEHAKTFGSLIQVPADQAEFLHDLVTRLQTLVEEGDSFQKPAANTLLPLVHQAWLLVQQYDAVVANPPYMGAKAFTPVLKEWLKCTYQGNDKDLFAAFIARMQTLTKRCGFAGVMTSFVWMFIATFEHLRKAIVAEQTINSLVQLHYDAFADAKAHVCTFVLQNVHIKSYKSAFIRLVDFPGVENQGPKTLQAIRQRDCGWFFESAQDEFLKIPGSPIAYWIKNAQPFEGPRIGDEFISGGRTKTHGNERYLRFWWEVERLSKTWAPYSTGGDFRKYSGNLLQVVKWSSEARSYYDSHGGLYPKKFWYKEGITWGKITSARVSFRDKPSAAHYDSGAGAIFSNTFTCDPVILGFLNSPIVDLYLKAMNPTVNTTVNDVLALPLPDRCGFPIVDVNVTRFLSYYQIDWDAYERSSNFQSFPILKTASEAASTLESSYSKWITKNRETINEMKRLEEENNRLFINAFGLADELSSDVPLEQITLTMNPRYRYGGNLTEQEQWIRFRQDSMEELISYAIGCMMGRYRIDKPGLIYAHAGNADFESIYNGDSTPSTINQNPFAADDDGIIPLTDQEWFKDDATNRFRDFVRTVWGEENLPSNLDFVAESLCLNTLKPKKSESSLETIRRYLSTQFYKVHTKTYKKRPIYWLFSSGKQKAFECLVYLHRYNESTLPRMRTEYVTPLLGKYDAFADQLKKQLDDATTSEAILLKKEQAALEKKQTELRVFDDKLKHYADRRIKLDLDDGVKVNYGKFDDLLAEVKAITGGKE